MKTIIEGYRTEGYPQLFAEFEYFYNEMKKKRTKTLTPHKRAGQATLFPLFSFLGSIRREPVFYAGGHRRGCSCFYSPARLG